MKGFAKGAALLAAMAALAGPVQGESKKEVPYWASIARSEARMRVGPSLDYPANWVYRRQNLPVKVVQVLGNWRKIEDPDGAQGWMHVRLLSSAPTAIIVGDVAPMRTAPRSDAPVAYRAEAGVVGRLSDCEDDWCRFDVGGRRGYVRVTSLWGGMAEAE